MSGIVFMKVIAGYFGGRKVAEIQSATNVCRIFNETISGHRAGAPGINEEGSTLGCLVTGEVTVGNGKD